MTPKDALISPKSAPGGSIKESKMIGFDPSNSPVGTPVNTGRNVTELKKE